MSVLRRLAVFRVFAWAASFALAAALAAALLAVAIAIGLAHHRRRTGLVLLDPHREVAQHVLVQPLLPLDFGERRGRGVHIHQGEMRLAVLAQAIAQRLEAPILAIG